MAFKKRSLKLAITTMAIISVVTSGGLNNIYADSSINNSSIVVERTLENKNYSVKNKIEYVKADGTIDTSSEGGYGTLRKSVSEDSVIEVKDGKTYMTIEFTDADYRGMGKMYNFIQNVRIVVDGKEHKFEKSDDKKYKVELGTLESDIQLIYDINANMGTMVYTKTFKMNVKLVDTPEFEAKNNAPVINVTDKSINVGDEFDALSGATSNIATDIEDGDLTSKLEVTNNVDTSKPGIYEVTYKVEDSQGLVTTKTIKVTVLAKEEIKPNELEDGKYTIKNKTTYSGNSSMGTSMVRNSLNEVSYIEVKDGEVYITIEFNKDMYSMMNDINISVDGDTIKPSIEGMKYTFKAKSINSDIEVSASIEAMNGMNIKYAIGLDESTIEKITSDSNIDNSNGTTEDTTNGSSNSSTNENTSSSENTTVENTVKKGKLYTIKNKVSHESETGREMARKYLNTTSKVEEIDGQKYVTLTFTGADLMKNHVIYVNGSKVSHTVAAKSGDSTSLRFKVSDLNDKIKVGMYVTPMSRTIEFTVELLEDTLTFVKDYEVSSESTNLPQTGSAIDTTMTVGIGSSLMALGTLLNRRKLKKF